MLITLKKTLEAIYRNKQNKSRSNSKHNSPKVKIPEKNDNLKIKFERHPKHHNTQKHNHKDINKKERLTDTNKINNPDKNKNVSSSTVNSINLLNDKKKIHPELKLSSIAIKGNQSSNTNVLSSCSNYQMESNSYLISPINNGTDEKINPFAYGSNSSVIELNKTCSKADSVLNDEKEPRESNGNINIYNIDYRDSTEIDFNNLDKLMKKPSRLSSVTENTDSRFLNDSSMNISKGYSYFSRVTIESLEYSDKNLSDRLKNKNNY